MGEYAIKKDADGFQWTVVDADSGVADGCLLVLCQFAFTSDVYGDLWLTVRPRGVNRKNGNLLLDHSWNRGCGLGTGSYPDISQNEESEVHSNHGAYRSGKVSEVIGRDFFLQSPHDQTRSRIAEDDGANRQGLYRWR